MERRQAGHSQSPSGQDTGPLAWLKQNTDYIHRAGFWGFINPPCFGRDTVLHLSSPGGTYHLSPISTYHHLSSPGGTGCGQDWAFCFSRTSRVVGCCCRALLLLLVVRARTIDHPGRALYADVCTVHQTDRAACFCLRLLASRPSLARTSDAAQLHLQPRQLHGLPPGRWGRDHHVQRHHGHHVQWHDHLGGGGGGALQWWLIS